MIKTVTFLRKKPGMSMEDFRDRYENGHAVLAHRYMPKARRYARRYITPVENPTKGGVSSLDFDVLTELWFDSRADYEETMAHLATPEVREVFAEDESALFDRSAINLVTLEEFETPIPAPVAELDEVKAVRDLYRAIGEGDWPVVESILVPEVVVEEVAGLPYAGTYRGHAGFRRLMEVLGEYWEGLHPVGMTLASGDGVVHSESVLVGVARKTGVRLEMPLVESWTFENGRIVKGRVYYADTHAVRAALGVDD